MSESIVIQVCRELKIHPVEFFGPKRCRRLTRARRIAIKRLIAAGFSMAGAARMIQRNYSTVRYWMNPKLRQKHNEYARNYWRNHEGRGSQGSNVREEAISPACLSDAGLHGSQADSNQVWHQATFNIALCAADGTSGKEGQRTGGLAA